MVEILRVLGSIAFSCGPAQVWGLLSPIWGPMIFISYSFMPDGERKHAVLQELKWVGYCMVPIIGPIVWHCLNEK